MVVLRLFLVVLSLFVFMFSSDMSVSGAGRVDTTEGTVSKGCGRCFGQGRSVADEG